jgi:hypothetical protein
MHTHFFRLTIFLLFAQFTAFSHAIEPPEQNFSFSKVEKGQSYKKILSIPDAYEIEAHITGSTNPTPDNIVIYDAENNHINIPLRGTLDWHKMLVGSEIQIQLKATAPIDGEVTIHITKPDSNQVYREIKEKLDISAKKLLETNASELTILLERQLKEVDALNTKIKQVQEVKPLMREVILSVQNLAKIYQQLAATHPALTRAQQQELEEIRLLKQRVQGYQYKSQHNYQHATETPEMAQWVTIYGAEQVLWEKFLTQLLELETKLQEFSEKISNLLEFFTQRAKMYQKSADLALMNETAWGVLKELTQETDLTKLISEISDRDTEIRKILNQL